MSDTPAPLSVWQSLSEDDRSEYLRLRSSFQQSPKISSKDRRIIAFPRELQIVIRYLEHSPDNIESRCIISGLCFVGPIDCINTRQLKKFLNRCKSSINGSFQQLGYVAFRTKTKARSCVIAALPALEGDQDLLRQWTCRVVSESATVCFLSNFRRIALPDITEEDLLDEKRPRKIGPVVIRQPIAERRVSFEPKLLDDDLPGTGDLDLSEVDYSGASMPFSFSMDCFREMEGMKSGEEVGDLDLWGHENRMAKSKSAEISISGDWDLFLEGLNDTFR
jgi:hypothetical protein